MPGKHAAKILCWVLMLTLSFLSTTSTLAYGDEEEKPIRLTATAFSGPIGTIAPSFGERGALTINGRPSQGGEMIWQGDKLEVQGEAGVLVRLDEVGELSLAKGSIVTLGTLLTRAEDRTAHHTLVASLLRGRLSAKLQKSSSAYLQTFGAAYTTSDGASFTISAQQNTALIATNVGWVRPEVSRQRRKFTIVPIGQEAEIRVRVGNIEQIRVQVTDEQNRPVSGVPITYALDTAGRGLGKLGLGGLASYSFTTTTNINGIASVPFTAGQEAGSTSVTTVVEEGAATWTGQIRVTPSKTGRNTLIVVGIAAAIGAGIGIAVASRENDTIQPLPPQAR